MNTSVIVLCLLMSVAHALWKEVGDAVLWSSKKVPKILNPLNLIYSNRCIEDLGCFYTGPPFYHPTMRPISLSPTSNPRVSFKLFTSARPHQEHLLEATEESLKNSSFDAGHRTKCLVHGFRTDLDYEDIRFGIKNELLRYGNYNVIVVDWTAINGQPYQQAVANSRVVGAKLAKLINFLINSTSVAASSFHVIGHSLGAHVAGYAGERVRNLGRITGLDPAGPYFHNAAREVRLDAGDAQFVDVIHTDGGGSIIEGLGIDVPIGHMDFYPNGGSRQPGCTYTSRSTGAVGAAINYTTSLLDPGCDHERASLLFLESIDASGCRFQSVLCRSAENFRRGRCPARSGAVAEMGLHARRGRRRVRPPSKYYLRTRGTSPFCDPKGMDKPRERVTTRPSAQRRRTTKQVQTRMRRRRN